MNKCEKYSYELKLNAVKYYMENKTTFKETAEHFNIKSVCSLKKWYYKYQENGPSGLIKNKKKSYSGEFKNYVIEYMHNNHLSLQQTSSLFNLGDHNVVKKWDYLISFKKENLMKAKKV